MQRLASYLTGQWQIGQGEERPIQHALTGEILFQVTTCGLPLSQATTWGREVGGKALQKMTFHQRAEMLRNLARHLLSKKEDFYALSQQTGATRQDSWVDIEGGIATLFTYASLAQRELPNDVIWPEDEQIPLSKGGQFTARHFLTSKPGIALHINAFNFPCWGMLEKLAPTWLAGMPAIIKPATATAQLTQAMVREMLESGLVPEGALQLVCGSVGDMLDHLDYQDVVTFTGSAQTGQKLRQHPRIQSRGIPFTMEADSLNCIILGEDVTPQMPEFSLFIKEVCREMTVKAGQKCTAIRRAIVPHAQLAAVRAALEDRLQKVVLGDPACEGVTMGSLVSQEQKRDVVERVAELCNAGCEVWLGGNEAPLSLRGEKISDAAFYPVTLLYCAEPHQTPAVHRVEAFGPVCTLMAYQDSEDAMKIALHGEGSLVGSLVTADPQLARRLVLGVAAAHGRLLVLNAEAAPESTGHGSPLPLLIHGGPGRAGGGEEMGGLRGIKHFMQRTAVQGSPGMLSAIGQEWQRGAPIIQDRVHPFRKFFEELQIGEAVITARRTVTEADIVNFAALSGDHFYAHVDEIAATESMFGARVAHGYFVVSAAAGLFVDPGEGPVLANYGLENLRFIEPVKIGDTIQVQLTCKKKIAKRQRQPEDQRQGVVVWDVQITNQRQETVALYSILTLVACRAEE